MMEEYNELTKQLLAAGYTADSHPDYVFVGRTCRSKDNPLDNLNGGFEYFYWYVAKKTFITPCGLMCKGSSCMTSMCYMGKEWTFENDLAHIHCPYRKTDCTQRHELLQDAGGVLKDFCNVHMTEDVYQYEGSVEDILKMREDEMRREKISFILQHNGRACENHMRYDMDTGKWVMHYDPGICASLRCNHGAACPILGRKLDTKRGNVYYDIKTTFRRYDLDGTLFEGQMDTSIQKGVRLFKNPVSMDICRNYVKLCKDKIKWKVEMKYHSELFFAEHFDGHEFSVEVLNIRAEHRESRNLMQDLQDIQSGITVTHASDDLILQQTQKKERRQQAKAKRIAAVEKKILSVGYENMERVDKNRACKLLDQERIAELEEQRKANLKAAQEQPVQISIFDILEN